MFTRGLDVCFVWEFDILFLEVDTEFFIHLGTYCMFIKSTEYLPIFPLEGECYTLSVEIFLYLKCLFETYACLILGSFFICFHFFEAFCGDFFCHSFWDEEIACLCCRHLDDLSFASHVSDILEEFYVDLAGCHIDSI